MILITLKRITMKRNFNRQFKDFRGNDIPGRSVAQEITEALFNHGKITPATEEEKRMAYILCKRIAMSAGEVEISTEEAALVKKVCAQSLTAGGYGQVFEIIEDSSL